MKKDILIIDNNTTDFISFEEYNLMSLDNQLDIDVNVTERTNTGLVYKTLQAVTVCDTIEEATRWLKCKRDTLYKSLHTKGIMQYKNYSLEIVEAL
jgi:hypothetical protein